MKRIVCEDASGAELFSFNFNEDIKILSYHNCEIADVELDEDLTTVIRLQQIKEASV